MEPQAIAQIYASDIVSGFDVYKPEKLNRLFARYGDQGASYYQLLRSMGFEEQVSLDEYSHYEENWIHENLTVTGTAAGAAGADKDETLDAASLDANNDFYARVGDIIIYPDETVGQVVEIDKSTATAPVLTVRPLDATEALPATSADDKLVIFTNAFAEGTGQPDGAIRGVYEYKNVAQIIKESLKVTGSEMVNQTWFPVNTFGDKSSAYYHLGQVDIDYRMALRIDGALLWGKKTTNTAAVDPETGRPIKTTEGLIPYIRRLGNVQDYDNTAFDVGEFDDMDYTLDRNFAGNYIMGLLGLKLHQYIENALVDYFADTNIQYARQTTNEVLFNSNESLGASVNFKYLTKSERTFLFKRLGVLNHPKLYGTEGYDFNEFGVFMPINRRKDPVSGNLVESCGVRYRGLGNYNRIMEVWQVGGAGNGLKVTDIDERNTYMRAHIGAHYRGINQFVLLEPQ